VCWRKLVAVADISDRVIGQSSECPAARSCVLPVDSTDARLLLTLPPPLPLPLLLLLLREHSVQHWPTVGALCASVDRCTHQRWTLPIVAGTHSLSRRSPLSIDSVRLDVRPECVADERGV